MIKAQWKKLVMANYTVNPQLLDPYLPYLTEYDRWQDQCFVSLVGFMFLNTQTHGIKLPFHKNFEEVNLRFYVLHHDHTGWKRGVVFIKEIVPLPLVSFVANTNYKEHYETLPMQHSWDTSVEHLTIEYKWKKRDWHTLKIISGLQPLDMPEEGEEVFFTDQHWGYSRVNPQLTLEYEVAHPFWKYYKTIDYTIEVDFGLVYGDSFSFLTQQKPYSVFLAEGSEITLKKSNRFMDHQTVTVNS